MLFDRLKVALADPIRHFCPLGHPQNIQDKIALKKLSDRLDQAHRFEADAAVHELMLAADDMNVVKRAWLYSKARLPFESMWVEWAAGEDLRTGFLAEQFHGTSYRAALFMGPPGNAPIQVSPIAFAFDPCGGSISPTHLSSEDTRVEKMMMGDDFIRPHEMSISVDDNPADEARAIEYILNSAAFLSFPPFSDNLFRFGSLDKAAIQTLTNSATRWVYLTLGIINTYEAEKSELKQLDNATKAPRLVNLKRVPFLEYRTLSIKIPKGRPLDYKIKSLSASMIRKRNHEVMGHWRTRNKTGEKNIWVHSHRRGDPTLGVIIKDYKLTG